MELVQAVKKNNGRFLEKKDGEWYEVKGDEGPRQKASKLLRDCKNVKSATPNPTPKRGTNSRKRKR